MNKFILSAILLATSFTTFGQAKIVTTGNNVINTADPYAADIVIGSDQGTRHDASIMWWSNASASRISNTADVFYFSTHNSSTPNVGLGSTLNGNSFIMGNLGIGINSPTSKLHVNGTFQSSNFRNANDGFFVGAVGSAASTGTFNTIVGYYAGANITSGGTNTIIGSGIANNLTTGYRNVIIGTLSGGYNLRTGQSITTGGDNIMIGAAAGGYLTTGIQNTYVGMGAGATSPAGMQNVALGKDAGLSADGSYNTLIGAAAGQIIHGNNNTFVGNKTAQNPVYGNSLTFIGANVGISAPDNLTNATGLGYNTQVTTSNTLILGNGANVGIGTSAPDAKLAVKGTVHASEVKVDLNVPGPDYVFEAGYKLPDLKDLQIYLAENKHLPDVPSAKEMNNSGINLSEMNMLLLKKVEELTLHLINISKEVEQLKRSVKKQ